MRPWSASELSRGYRLGLFLIKQDDEVVKIGHSGLAIGGMSHLYHYPRSDGYIALFTNAGTEDTGSFLQFGGELLVGTGTESIMSELEAIVMTSDGL